VKALPQKDRRSPVKSKSDHAFMPDEKFMRERRRACRRRIALADWSSDGHAQRRKKIPRPGLANTGIIRGITIGIFTHAALPPTTMLSKH
jgi:hypothetical protein